MKFSASPNIHQNARLAIEDADILLNRHPELSDKIRRAIFCPSQEVAGALTEVVKFLYLAASSESGNLTPSHRVDLAWHEFILFTRAYQQFCESRFGKFIHHQPGERDHDHRRSFEITLNRYRETFGEPPKEFWGINESGAACGACESTGE